MLLHSLPAEVAPPERVNAERTVLKHDVYVLETERCTKGFASRTAAL